MWSVCRVLFLLLSGFALIYVIQNPFGEATAEEEIIEKIVGGEGAEIEEYPYQISIRSDRKHICGGSIVNPNTIITAAHCVDGIKASSLKIIAGTSILNGTGEVRKVKKIFVDPQYSKETYDHDLAVLILDGNFEFNDKINAIAYSKYGHTVKTGSKAVVTGWGALRKNGTVANKLQFVHVRVVCQKTCHDAYGKKFKITNNMICAGEEKGRKGFCQGDSGGPMVVDNVLVGVVSGQIGCARPDYPGVYSRVANMRPWLDTIIQTQNKPIKEELK